MSWKQVIGQEKVKAGLRELLSSGRLAHAYLFQGDEGVGKDAAAFALARALHCLHNDVDPCGECASCMKLERLQHPDVHLVFALPVGKDERKGDAPFDKLSPSEVEEVREQIRRKAENPYHRISIARGTVIKVNSVRGIRREAVLSTTGLKRRVVIISRADEMNEESSNALLKTLEEPSSGTLFLLTTAYPERLLPTIRSRCHTIQFEPLSAADIAQRLIETGQADQETGRLVAHLALGSYRRAVELLSQDMAAERSQAVDLIRLMLGNSFSNLMARIEDLASGKDRDLVVRFIGLISIWFRDTLVYREGREILNVDQRESIHRFTEHFQDVDYPDLFAQLDQAVSLVRRNGYIPLVLVRLSLGLKRAVFLTRALPHGI